MKQIILIIMIFSFIGSIYGQEIELKGIYASSSSKKYNTNVGYSIGYNQFVKAKNRFGISVIQYFSKTPYDDIYGSGEDGVSTYIEQVDPNNQRIALRLNYVFRLIDNSKSRLYFGPEIGLNYFFINEQYERISNEYISGGNFSSDYTETNRIGIGFLLEFEIKEVINKKISTYLSVNPEITSFEKFGMNGGYDPYFIGWMNFNLGIRYLLNEK
ncbi:MAG: hypothetical protein U9R42_02310 [Bacteroidota bacterium]|nr:hypothetical protein [Bacteroidota bacterium]